MSGLLTSSQFSFLPRSVFLVGSFGNGVLSYFTFLKWLLLLNIYVFTLTLSFVIIPQALSTGEGLPLESPPNVSAHGRITNATSLFEIRGSQTETVYVRQRRDIKSNETVPWGTIERCHLVRPDDDYTDKPITQLVMDFISGVVSSIDYCFWCRKFN